MKKIILFILLFIVSFLYSEDYFTNGYYLCYSNTIFVKYKGPDTPEKRKKARDIYGCSVIAVYGEAAGYNSNTYVIVLGVVD